MRNFTRTLMGSALFLLLALTAFATQGHSAEIMTLEGLRQAAFARCQAPYVAPIILPVPVLDPPREGGQQAEGMVFHEELAVKTSNLLDRDEFYVSPRPRAAVNSLPMEVFVNDDKSSPTSYQPKTWYDANPDYSSSVIQPPIAKDMISDAGRVLTELIIGHKSPSGEGWPQLFDIRSSAYVRFAGFPPQVTGASLRLGAHGILSPKEDFPIIRAVYVSVADHTTAKAMVLLESELFCGALDLDLIPGEDDASIVVDSYWYTRQDFHWQKEPNTGFVAYSSMLWKTEKHTPERSSDEAHDSDTMIVKYTDGSQVRIALDIPSDGTKVRVRDLTSQSAGKEISEWTLANEDRDPSHYADFKPALGKTNYDLRSSYSVAVLESSVKTGVRLIEMEPVGEYADNMVALSTIRQDIPKAKSADEYVRFKYKTKAFYPQTPDECEFIRDAIRALPESTGGTVHIPAGVFECRRKIVVKKSHVKIQGEGRDLTTLKLADQSPSPILVIGDDQVVKAANGNWVTRTRVSDIEISDLTVDGNLRNQDPTKECGNGACDGDVANIRNNAITVRGASYVKIERVTSHSAISGGLVTEKYCDHLLVKDFTSYGNYFDGFAGYQTEDSLFDNMNLSRNHGAGISIDIQFNRNRFLGGLLASNGDVGIFARDLKGNVFENLSIIQSGNHGVFLAQSDHANSCAVENEFRAIQISGSKGYGIFVADACPGNRVTGNSVIEKNKDACFFVNPGTTMPVESSVICR